MPKKPKTEIDEALETAFYPEDKLDRMRTARFLTHMTIGHHRNTPENHFVMNINAEWGFGKTFLIDRWVAALQATEIWAVKYNAWQNDFTDQPLLSFITEIESQLFADHGKTPTKKFKAVKKGAINVAKALPEILMRATLSWALKEGMTSLIEAVNNDGSPDVSTISGPIVESMMNQHKNSREAIKAFTTSLEAFAASDSQEDSGPLFIFVDELDRCRPDFAIRLLEVIKHLFEVKGVYFIIATDTKALSAACQAVYGPNFEGRRYLKRFFTMEYTLPAPQIDDFVAAHFQKYNWDNDTFFWPTILPLLSPETESAESITSKIFMSAGMGLRDVEQAFIIMKAVLDANKLGTVHLIFFAALVALRVRDADTFQKTLTTSGTIQFEPAFTFKFEKSFQISDYDVSGGGRRKAELPLIDLVTAYKNNIYTNRREILDELNNDRVRSGREMKILTNMTTEITSSGDSYHPYLARYPEAIAQAGQLIL